MQLLRTIIITVLTLLVLSSTPGAQSITGNSWRTFIHLSGGYFLADNKWEISHPYYDPSGPVTWETITGDIAIGGTGSCGIELTKKHIGFQLDLSFLPMRFRTDPSTQYIDLNAYVTELSFLVYPSNSRTKKVFSFIALGGGLFFSDADVVKSGYLLSGKIGLRSFVSDKVGISISFAGKYIIHHQVQIQDQIQKDLNMTSAAIFADLIYRL